MAKVEIEEVCACRPIDAYTVIKDVENYPQFVTGCKALRVLRSEPSYILAVMTVNMPNNFGSGLDLLSHINLHEEDRDLGNFGVDVSAEHKWMKSIYVRWRVSPASADFDMTNSQPKGIPKTHISLSVTASATHFPLRMLIVASLSTIVNQIRDDFISRVESAYAGRHNES